MVGMLRHVALLRGINVGTAKRIPMADLRSVFETVGYTNVRTHLQSGNVVFDAPATLDGAATTDLEAAIAEGTGVHSRVLVLRAEMFLAIAEDNPFADASDPSRMVVTFLDTAPDESATVRPSDEELAPERIVFGRNAIYQWCPDGILKAKIIPGSLHTPATVTTSRNLRTVTRLVKMIRAPDAPVA
jgi:uncharacterized protein (DUF1697 family)